MSDIEQRFSYFPEAQEAQKVPSIPKPALPKKLPEGGKAVSEIAPFDWAPDLQSNIKMYPEDCAENHGEDALFYLLQETKFIPVANDPDWKKTEMTPEVAKAVGKGAECPVCKGTNKARRLYKGTVTGIRVNWPIDCRCLWLRLYYKNWNDLEHVKLAYRDIRWRKLMTPEVQKRFRRLGDAFKKLLMTVLTEYPDNNLLMVGPGGCGKTTITCALYDRALREWAGICWKKQILTNAVWLTKALPLSAQFRHFEMQRENTDENAERTPPLITTEKVQGAIKRGFKPHVFIDEFDKFNMNSTFQRNTFAEILDEVQANGGQIVCCTNTPVELLMQQLGVTHGGPMVRRLVGAPHGTLIDFFTHQISIDSERVLINGDGVLAWAKNLNIPVSAGELGDEDRARVPDPTDLPDTKLDFEYPKEGKEPSKPVDEHFENAPDGIPDTPPPIPPTEPAASEPAKPAISTALKPNKPRTNNRRAQGDVLQPGDFAVAKKYDRKTS
jgi:hypothetical protein